MYPPVPFVSVIMPVRNEGDFIARSLGAVLAQDYPHEQLEIFVADGMSTDNSRQLIERLAAATDIPVSIVDNPGLFVPHGFNAAFRRSRGEIIVRVDGHCEIASDYITRCVQHLQAGEAAGVGGPIETVSSTPMGETIALAMSSPFGVGGSSFRTVKDRTQFVDTIPFPAYLRAVMERAGLLDEDLMRNQDDEYNYRLGSLGYKLLLTPDVRSRYYSRSSLTKLWRQYYLYGVYKVRVMQKHPQQMRSRQFAPLLLVSGVLGGAVFALVWAWIRPFWILGLLAYVAANLLASIYLAQREGWQYLFRLPPVFAALHFGYGLGFLRGLVKFRSHWGKTRNL